MKMESGILLYLTLVYLFHTVAMAKQERHRNDISYDGNYYVHVHNEIMIHTLWTVNDDFTVKESLERVFSASEGSFQVKARRI